MPVEQTSPGLVGVFGCMNPSIEHVAGLLIEYQTSIRVLRTRFASDSEKLVLLDLCDQKLEEAGKALGAKRCYRRKKVFMAWDLLHQVSADMILFMEVAELAATGRKLIIDLKASSLPDTAKNDWIVQLEDALKKLKGANSAEAEVEYARQLVRMATFTINSQVDALFWDIWTKKFLGSIYTILLLLHLYLFLREYNHPIGFDVTCITNVALLGVLGGLLSGIFSGEPQYIAKGHFWFATLYQSLVRPAQGALAAILMFWMLQSQYLIKISPPLGSDTRVHSAVALVRPVVAAQAGAPKEKGAAAPVPAASAAVGGDPNRASMIVLNAAEGMQAYLYLVVLLMAGFTGDKLLKTVSDKVTSRLYASAEKTREGK